MGLLAKLFSDDTEQEEEEKRSIKANMASTLALLAHEGKTPDEIIDILMESREEYEINLGFRIRANGVASQFRTFLGRLNLGGYTKNEYPVEFSEKGRKVMEKGVLEYWVDNREVTEGFAECVGLDIYGIIRKYVCSSLEDEGWHKTPSNPNQ